MALTVNQAFNNDNNSDKSSKVKRAQAEPASAWIQVEANPPEYHVTGTDYSDYQKTLMKEGKLVTFTDGTKAYLCDGLYHAVGDDGKPLVPPTLIDAEEIAAKTVVKNKPEPPSQPVSVKRNKIPPAIQSKISMMNSGVSGLEYEFTDKGLVFNGEVSLINSDFLKYSDAKNVDHSIRTLSKRSMHTARIQNLAISQAIYQDLSKKSESELTQAEINFMNSHEQNMIKLYKEYGEM